MASQDAGFPRLMGINIGAKNYDDPGYQRDLGRLDVVILGFFKGWQASDFAQDSVAAMQSAVRAIKANRTGILVGQYTVLSEAYNNPLDPATADLRNKLLASNWWLRNAGGSLVQWTSQFSTWEINFTAWSQPDAAGMRWPEWLAERNAQIFFRAVPAFDIVYLDNVMVQPRVSADWKLNGVNDDPGSPDIVAAHRAGHRAYWDALRARLPSALLIGNVDNDLSDPLWRSQLDGAVLEALMGESWSIEANQGWNAMMARYRAVLANTRAPNLVGFNVAGAVNDYRFFRYAYVSCLLDNGYFAFSDKARGYSSVPWFDEYDFKLGRALASPPTTAWSNGVWRRDFEQGIVLVNPTPGAQTVSVDPGLQRLSGSQDPAANSGANVDVLTLQPKDGIVLRRAQTVSAVQGACPLRVTSNGVAHSGGCAAAAPAPAPTPATAPAPVNRDTGTSTPTPNPQPPVP